VSVIEIIFKEISDMTFSTALNMLIFISFAWFISKFAKATIPRLLFISVGLYLIISSALVSDQILYDVDTLFGIGVILPHISFFIAWIAQIYEDFKQATIDTYVFGLTIYYKTINFFLWFYDTYKKIYSFFTKKERSQEQEEQKDYYQKQQYRDFGNFSREKTNRRNNQQEEKKEYESDFSSSNEETSQKKESSSYKSEENKQNFDNSQEEKSQKEQDQESETNYSKRETHEEETSDELSLEEQLMRDERYKHLFSQSIYTILGVNASDDFETMKKSYRKLAHEYHPDKHRDETEKYNILFKRINHAYEWAVKLHKK